MWKEISHLPRHVQRGTDQMHHLCKLSENLDLDPASWKFLVNRKNRWPYSKFMSRIVVVPSKLNQSFPAPKKWKYTIADWIWHSFNEQFSNAFIQQLVSQPTGFFWQFKDLSASIPLLYFQNITVRVHSRLARVHTVYTLHSGLPCQFNQPFIPFNYRLVRLNV